MKRRFATWENFQTLSKKHWFHESSEIAFSVHQYAKNLLTQSLVPFKRGFLTTEHIRISRPED